MLQSRPTIDDLVASLLPAGWRLELLHWRDDERWECHLLDANAVVWFGYGDDIESALHLAATCSGGSFPRAQRPAAHQPAITNLLQRLIQKPKIDLGRRV